MKKLSALIVIVVLVFAYSSQQGISLPGSTAVTSDSNNAVEKVFKTRQSNIQLQGQGVVIKLLKDDNEGLRHQKFILKMRSGLTLLVAHNIDLAARINDLKVGDSVEFYGEYEWNNKGGVIHWTHHDPNNHHIGGWLKHNAKTYQ
jgi:hypothetical protein